MLLKVGLEAHGTHGACSHHIVKYMRAHAQLCNYCNCVGVPRRVRPQPDPRIIWRGSVYALSGIIWHYLAWHYLGWHYLAWHYLALSGVARYMRTCPISLERICCHIHSYIRTVRTVYGIGPTQHRPAFITSLRNCWTHGNIDPTKTPQASSTKLTLVHILYLHI